MRTSYTRLLGIFITLGMTWACRGTTDSGDLNAPIDDSSIGNRDDTIVPGSNNDSASDSPSVSRCVPPKELDVLFLIDNSTSMAPKQKALSEKIGTFITRIDEVTKKYGVNYHVGVATSDVGGNKGIAFGGNFGSCDTKEGDDGLLQNIACTQRMNVTPTFTAACNSVCPNALFVPNNGARYIEKIYKKDGQGNVIGEESNVPKANTMNPVSDGIINTFKCIGLVGDLGCGLEAPFEGAKRALDGHRSENAGFLSTDPSSILAIIFITDEDDCSVQFEKRDQNNPMSRDCTEQELSTYGYQCFHTNYRCFASANDCQQSLLTTGLKTNCRPKTDANNYLESIQKYVDFFKGKKQMDRLVVAGIWTLPSVINKNGQDEGKVSIVLPNMKPDRSDERQLATTGMEASCYNTTANVGGASQIRLSKLARELSPKDYSGNPILDNNGQPLPNEFSICDITNYDKALDGIANVLAPKIGCDVR